MELNTMCTVCNIAEEIKCFQAVSAHRRSGLHYQLRQCRPCSGRDQNGSRFMFTGREENAVRATGALTILLLATCGLYLLRLQASCVCFSALLRIYNSHAVVANRQVAFVTLSK